MMKSKKYILRQLTEEDRWKISQLRRELLRESYPFLGMNNSLNWGPTDRKSLVFGIWEERELLSSLRLELIDSLDAFESRFEIQFPLVSLKFPLWATSRGVTRPSHQGRGLYSILKMHCLQVALEMGIEDLITLVKDDSFQLPSMQALGYEFFKCSKLEGCEHFDLPTSLGHINLTKNFETAKRAIHNKYPEILKHLSILDTTKHNPKIFEINSVRT